MSERLRAAEWTVRPCGRSDVVPLLELHHYARGAANTCVASHGLYRVDEGVLGQPYGGALWMPPTVRAAQAIAGEGEDWRGVLVLSRLVVAPDVPANGASFLLGASMRLLDRDRWPILATYADTRHGHTGAIYRATNWCCDGEVKAGDVWIGPDGEQRGRKRGRRNLSAAEMRAAGFERAPAAPKLRFTHRVPLRA